MDPITKDVARYVRGKGIAVSTLAEKTGLAYKAIYPSLCPEPIRKLRADEFMKICVFLDVDPKKFDSLAYTNQGGAIL